MKEYLNSNIVNNEKISNLNIKIDSNENMNSNIDNRKNIEFNETNKNIDIYISDDLDVKNYNNFFQGMDFGEDEVANKKINSLAEIHILTSHKQINVYL